MEQLIDPNTWLGWLSTAQGWVQTTILVPATLVQILVLIGSYFVAKLVARPGVSLVKKILSFPWAERYHERLISMAVPLVLPLIALVLLGVARLTGQQLGAPVALLQVSVSLLAAWVFIRFALNFIADPWWSRAIAVSAWIVAALNILDLLEVTQIFLESVALDIGEVHLSVYAVLKAIVVLVLFLWGANALSALIQRKLADIPNLTSSQEVLFGKLAHILLIATAILVAINSLGVDLTALAVFSGALGVGIGFGLQKIVANLISGVILLSDRSVKPGDVIAINETYGWVKSIGARYVSIVTRDGIEHLVPNEQLISTAVENWSFTDRQVRQRLPLSVSYDSDLKLAIKLAEGASADLDRILKDPEPKCLVKGFGDNAVDLELRVWIEDAEQGVSNIKSMIYLEIWDLFKANNIEFAFPQRDIHITNPVTVRLEQS